MTSKLFGSGVFTRDMQSFYKGSKIKYIISTRKEPTLDKPLNFILAIQEGRRFYISSLYPTSKLGVYNVEYRGERYTVQLEPERVIVQPRRKAAKITK